MDKIASKIFVSKDYDKFKTLGGNRFVDHSDKIVESIKNIGQLIAPIIVNEKFEVIDGQNRFEAYKKLELPVYYIIAEGYGISECVAMNSVSKNWTTDDYINSHAELGNRNYQILKDFIGEFKSTISKKCITATLAGRVEYYEVSKVRSGEFTVGPKGADYYYDMLTYMSKFDISNIKGKSDYIHKVIGYCYNTPEIDNNKLLTFYQKYSYQIESVVNTKQASEALERVYNYKCNKTNYVFISAMYHQYATEIQSRVLYKKPSKLLEASE
jgi:hypothetical protein